MCGVYQIAGNETRSSFKRTAAAGRGSQALHASSTDTEGGGTA